MCLALHSRKLHFASEVGKMSSRTTGIRTRDFLFTGQMCYPLHCGAGSVKCDTWSQNPFKVIRPHEKICLFPVSRPTPSKWGRAHFFFEFFCTRHQCERAHVVPTSSYVMEEQKVGRSASVIVVFRFLFQQTFSTC